MKPQTVSVASGPRRYFIEFNGAFLLYLATVLGRGRLAEMVDAPVLKTLIVLSPILPVCLAALAIVRLYRRMDEYHRLQFLETIAFSAGVTAVIAICWAFLEDVGFPSLPLFAAWLIMGVIWAVVSVLRAWREKFFEGQGLKALGGALLTLVYVAAGTGVYAAAASFAGWSTHWAVLVLVATGLFIARMGLFIFSKTKSC